MRISAFIPTALLAVLIMGCGGDPGARQVRELRLTGQPDSARALALSLLSEKAGRMEVWQEFVRTSLDINRHREEEDDPSAINHVVEATLVSGAMNVHGRRRPGRKWQELNRLTASEISRQINRIVGAYEAESRTAAYLQQLMDQSAQGGGADRPIFGPLWRTQQLVQQYRDNARQKLIMSAVWRQLLESVQEAEPGTSLVLSEQLQNAQNTWIRELKLEAAFVQPVQQSARDKVDAAFGRLQSELDDLGYFLPGSVIENGVLP